MFCIEYTDLNQNTAPLDGAIFICIGKDIYEVNSNLWHQKYFIPCAKLLGFAARRVMSKSSVLVLPDDIGVT